MILRKVLFAFLCSGALTFSPGRAQEKEDPEETTSPTEVDVQVLEPIVVNARKRTESLEDVPATITVFTDETIEYAGIDRAGDFINLTPGVSWVVSVDSGEVQVNIRGLNGTRDAETNFALNIDGIVHTNPSALNREFRHAEQIEILKGPQGALYGRNAAAGAIVITTPKPGPETRFDAEVSAATDSTYAGSVLASGALLDNRLFGQITADFFTTDGFYENRLLVDPSQVPSLGEAPFGVQSVIDDREVYDIGGRFVLEPTENLSLDAKIHYSDVEAAGIPFNATLAIPAFADAFGNPDFNLDVNDHRFVFQRNIDNTNDQETLEVSLKADYELGFATLSGWTLYSDIDQFVTAGGTSSAFGFFFQEETCRNSAGELFAAGISLPSPYFLGPTPEDSFLTPFSPTTCDGTQLQMRNQEDWSAEISLSSAIAGPMRWELGGYFLDIEREVAVNLGIDRGLGVSTSPFVPQDGFNPTEQLLWDRFDSRVWAVFGNLAYDVRPDLELSAALRFDRERRQVENLVPVDARTQFVDFDPSDGFTGGAPLNPGLDPNINPDGLDGTRERSFEQLQPKLSARWDATDDLTLFTNWGIGFRSGGFNNSGSAATVDVFINQPIGTSIELADEFDKETTNAFEAGFRSIWLNGRLSVGGALYYMDVTDMQFHEFFVGPFGLVRVTTNIDEVDILGGELSVVARPFEGFEIIAGANVTDSEIKANSVRPDTVGNKSPATPDYTLNLSGQYRRPIFGNLGFFARADYRLTGPTEFHTVQDQLVPTVFGPPADMSSQSRDAFDLLDLRVGVEGYNWRVTAFVENALDDEFLIEAFPAPEFGGTFVAPGTQRRVGIEGSFWF